MWKSIFQYISANYPIILLVGGACGATWFVKTRYDLTNELKNKADKLPCEQHKIDIESIIKNQSKLDDISSSIRKIEEWILKMDIAAMSDLVRKCSPYQLTDIGVLLLTKSHAKDCVDENLGLLIDLLEKTDPKTNYDVEKNSLNVLSSLTEDSIFNDIKNYIYFSSSSIPFEGPNGSQKVEISMQRILMTMSIYLRDKYLQYKKD